MPIERKRWVWIALLVLYAVAIFVVSGLPVGSGPSVLAFPGRDKVLHAIEFALFFLLARKAFGRTTVALALAAIYAGSDELHQAFVPVREASFADFAFDLVGACVAAFVVSVSSRGSLLRQMARRILDPSKGTKEGGN